MALQQNQNPQNVYNREINFTTTNLSNGNVFSEPHVVTLVNGIYQIPLNQQIINGNQFGPCIVIPLTTNTGFGAPYLKIHLPQNNESVMYVTFAQKNASMVDGYYDYIQGIPESYRTALRNWILDEQSFNSLQTTPLSKKLTFKVKGFDTNQVSASVEFTIEFKAIFGIQEANQGSQSISLTQ